MKLAIHNSYGQYVLPREFHRTSNDRAENAELLANWLLNRKDIPEYQFSETLTDSDMKKTDDSSMMKKDDMKDSSMSDDKMKKDDMKDSSMMSDSSSEMKDDMKKDEMKSSDSEMKDDMSDSSDMKSDQ